MKAFTPLRYYAQLDLDYILAVEKIYRVDCSASIHAQHAVVVRSGDLLYVDIGPCDGFIIISAMHSNFDYERRNRCQHTDK